MAKTFRNFIAGEWVAPANGAHFENRNPADTTDELRAWAERIGSQPWQEAFVFLKHDEEGGTGPEAALALRGMI